MLGDSERILFSNIRIEKPWVPYSSVIFFDICGGVVNVSVAHLGFQFRAGGYAQKRGNILIE